MKEVNMEKDDPQNKKQNKTEKITAGTRSS